MAFYVKFHVTVSSGLPHSVHSIDTEMITCACQNFIRNFEAFSCYEEIGYELQIHECSVEKQRIPNFSAT